MQKFLEYFTNYFDFLYLDPQYRITDSQTDQNSLSASMTVTGTHLIWRIINERGQMQVTVAPTPLATSDNWFWISLIRQYLAGHDDIQYLSADEEIRWARANTDRVTTLFADTTTLESTCEALRALRRSNADKTWGTVS